MKKDFSFIDKIGIKYSLVILLILLGPDIFKIFKLIFFSTFQVLLYKNMWLDFSVGMFLIFIATLPLKYSEEKIGIISFGVALLFNSLQNFIGAKISLALVVLFELVGAYFFWLTYKTYKQKGAEYNCVSRKRITFILLFLLLPPLLIWMFAIIQSRAQHSLILR
jgi:hypothetical protein